jgi:hypothetical protein
MNIDFGRHAHPAGWWYVLPALYFRYNASLEIKVSWLYWEMSFEWANREPASHWPEGAEL